ncbi:PHP-associated domain-containing protein [Methanofollis fontis]|uniref:Phosphotransferase n=1 Tax=Methanofollis fontis TaxID=2052832 RepID=A0A483CST4_9EURY|nr:PHP-associated domain-containing protein [Methanofollis fontis]TAJ45404.1 phosphotransferase [Methanofollis fontis]
MPDDATLPPIAFRRPDAAGIRRCGLLPADLHVHTRHSDSWTRVSDALRLARQRGIGLAITDHNQIGGALEAERAGMGVPLIPGIEVSAADGPHILLYFSSTNDLREFYRAHIEPQKGEGPCLAIGLTTAEILDAREGYHCVAVEAHPCGYAFLNRGVERCIASGCADPGIFSRFDALEVICGGMTRSHNLKAAALAHRHALGRTGGTDAHLLHDIGNVVTCAPAETAEEFLEAIRSRATRVVGQEKNILARAATGTAALPHHIPYALPILKRRCEECAPLLGAYLRSRLN